MNRKTLTEFQLLSVQQTLKKLLFGDTFYISDLDGLAKLLGAEVGGDDYQALRGLHCMKWAEMPTQLREQARRKVVELLGLDLPIAEEIRPPAPENSEPQVLRPRLSFWKR